ncbi:hypothetical protein PS2_274 [Serratia phage PS2]|uniref:DUF7418 domain-containing protein n=1 Tax=Serratia phage PS2 TaxID=1481112 RepID=A0A023W6Y5_9CAUD|nr:hypothetical protein FF83_gp141 [Serratia phage PS2]AHY25512.1 hypothetical protein PS2_274 [Serratia phage PS2]
MAIKPFNVSDSAEVNLRGEHRAGRVWAKDVVLHAEDLHYGVLYCDELSVGYPGEDEPNLEELEADDRIYFGIVHVRDVVMPIKELNDE